MLKCVDLYVCDGGAFSSYGRINGTFNTAPRYRNDH